MRRMDIIEHRINDVEGRIAFSEFRGKGEIIKMTDKMKFYTYAYQMIYILVHPYICVHMCTCRYL